MSRVDDLHRGFRKDYLSYEQLTAQLQLWAEAFPDICQLTSLTKTVEGRDVWLLTIGRDPDRLRPAAWIDGNMHASEVTGSSVALAVAEDLLRLHCGEQPMAPFPEHLGKILLSGLAYVVPRVAPDGAERVLTEGRFVRSNVRDGRHGMSHAYWRPGDVDGDGKALVMRKEDPSGDFATSREVKNLLLPRRIEDEPPYYRVYPEGTVENFNGFDIPAPSMMSDMETDLNRNFPSDWRAEPDQIGAGAFAASEPESRAMTEFVVDHPNIFSFMNLHTFGGVFIRPAGDMPDKKMNQSDLAVFHQLEEWATELTGYPMVSGFEEFTYEPDKPLHGDLSNFMYVERGAISFVVELWDFFKQAGLEVHRPFVFNYQRRTRDDILKMAKWDAQHNDGRIVGQWRPFNHPQLGTVDVGGYDPRIGVWNPPPDRLAEVCLQQTAFFLRLASLAPRVVVDISVERIDEPSDEVDGDKQLTDGEPTPGLFRIRVDVENLGYLPTYILDSSKGRPFNDPLTAQVQLGNGLTLASGRTRHTIGHLEGWGGHHKWQTPIFARSSGAPLRHRAEWIVRGQGDIELTVGAARVGKTRKVIRVGERASTPPAS